MKGPFPVHPSTYCRGKKKRRKSCTSPTSAWRKKTKGDGGFQQSLAGRKKKFYLGLAGKKKKGRGGGVGRIVPQLLPRVPQKKKANRVAFPGEKRIREVIPGRKKKKKRGTGTI